MTVFRGKWPAEPENDNKKSKGLLKNGERSGIVLAAALIIYGVINSDVPLCFFMLAFILFYGHVWLERSQLTQLASLSNVLKGLSITMLIGSVIMIFM